MDNNKTINGLKLVQLYEKDFNDIMEYLMEHFVPNEPTARSVRMSRDDGWELIEGMVRDCLRFPYSYTLKNENNEMVAIRLATVIEKTKLNETNKYKSEGLANDSKRMAKSAMEIDKLITTLESKIWQLVTSSTKKLLEIMIISTHENYTRRGLMKELLMFDLTEQKRDGIQGIVAEATAANSQKLSAKLGFQVLHQINYNEWLDKDGKQIFKCSDGTNCAQLVLRLH